MSEIEPFARAVLSHHYPETPLHGDFTTIQAGDYAAIDVLVGGTPCQSFSVAGLRKGMADERGNLALEYLRLADRLRPRWLVWENVPGVLSSNGGRDFGSFLGGLGQLGYGFAYRVLDAQYFGLAQRRKRVFVVGYLGDWRRAAAVLFEPESLRGNPAPRREARQIAPTIPSRSSSGGGLGTDFDCDGGLIAAIQERAVCTNAAAGPDGIGVRTDGLAYTLEARQQVQAVAYGGNNTFGPIDVASALNACHTAIGRQDFESETFIAHALRGEGFDASEDGTGRGTPIIPIDMRQASRGATMTNNRSEGQSGGAPGTGIGKDGDPAPTIAGSHVPAVAFDCKASGQSGFGIGEIANTMRAMGHSGSHQNGGGHQAVATSSAVRRLTPRECERLQGFTDDYTLIPWRRNFASDGPRYKALGNSMAVPVMRWIGSRIDAVASIDARAAA